ncbi:MAG TPA: trypsin-like peptidase domain-containing protein [Candidatus Eisenbacteria bacterium]|nr:trypsin-like peptidase domain-containing protein [Candidatus Eisenbacteria bacterium]
MTDRNSGYPARFLLITLLLSAVVSMLFGFASGLIAGNQHLRRQVLSVLAPSLEKYVGFENPAPEQAKPGQAAPAEAAVSDEDRTVAVVESASPAVVSIVISKDVPVYEQYYANPFGDGQQNDLFRQFFENNPGIGIPQYRQKGTEHQEIGAGSGFLASADGMIITNRHVVADEAAEYTVILQDGRKFPGKVLGRDSINDVAILKIEKADGKDFPFIPLGDSSKLKVGQKVVAIGYALGRFDNTASTGIVSGLERRIQAGDGMNRPEDLFGVIQTDAAINPGNSGGPLLNLRGEAIGVNVAIVQGSQNIGFALPINDIRKVLESVQKGGKISRPFLGVRYVMINKAIKEKNQLSVDHGALIARGDAEGDLAVAPGSPADLAGLVENDIILEVEGKKLTDEYPLFLAIGKFSAGDKVTLKVLHKGKEIQVVVTLVERQ